MTIDTGIQGAKRQSHSGHSPRDILAQVVGDNPKADIGKIWAEFRNAILRPENAEYLDSLIDYWLTNNARPAGSPRVGRPVRTYDPAPRMAAESRIRDAVVSKVQEAAKALLLDEVMANGKRLRHCTGSECGQMAEQHGKQSLWLSKIADRVPGNKLVGDVLDENAVRKINKILFGR